MQGTEIVYKTPDFSQEAQLAMQQSDIERNLRRQLYRAKKSQKGQKKEYIDIQARLQHQLEMGKREAAVFRGECNEDGVPFRYFCPIAHQIMKDPAFATDGHVYERHFIEEWIRTCKTNNVQATSPMTKYEIYDVVTPNHHLKNEIQDWFNFKAQCDFERCVATNYPEPRNKKHDKTPLDREVALEQARREAANVWQPSREDFRVANCHCIDEDGYPWWNKTRQLLKDHWIQVRAEEICDNRRHEAKVRWGKIFMLLQARLSDAAEVPEDALLN